MILFTITTVNVWIFNYFFSFWVMRSNHTNTTRHEKFKSFLYTPHTVYPKKYAHGFCFAVLCCGYTLTDFPISIRLTSLALWQSNDCPSASKATLMNMDTYFMWIHYERLHNHNKAKHNKTVCIFLGIYCTSDVKFNHAVNLCHATIRNRRLNSKCILTHPWRQIVSFRSVSLRKLLSVLSLSGVSLSPSAVLITIRYWSKLMITGIYDTASRFFVVLCV